MLIIQSAQVSDMGPEMIEQIWIVRDYSMAISRLEYKWWEAPDGPQADERENGMLHAYLGELSDEIVLRLR